MFFELLLNARLETTIERTIHLIQQNPSRTPFLTYDLASLSNWYPQETRIFGHLPYTELAFFLDTWPAGADLQVTKTKDQFSLASHPPHGLGRLQASIHDAFKKERRVDSFDSLVVRLEKYIPASRTFEIRPSKYSDGLRSNYAMDWHAELETAGQPFSLRTLMAQDYGPQLPPLDEPRLSNALGLAVIVWYRTEDGDILPYLPRRAERSAVFHGGYHCTASGEAEWNAHANTFDQMFTSHICQELYEEVGLSRDDLEWIVPVALCREFLRGGKPQLFFVALANVPASELATKRREAIQRQIVAGRQEILDDVLIAESPEQVLRDLAERGTIEAFANMCYAQKCAEFAHSAGWLTPGCKPH